MPPKKNKEVGEKGKKKEFIWTDSEAELLLNVAIGYKTSKAAESVDWESVKSKYDEITQLFIDTLPEETDDTDFPHKKDQITKLIVSSKLKAIRFKFRQAVDSGRRSGHGRVVMIYYELCQQLWAGSPATEQINVGFESTELASNDLNLVVGDESHATNESMSSATEDTSTAADCSGVSNPNNSESDELQLGEEDQHERRKESTKQRREFLDDKLKNYKQEKLKRKLPVDTQLLCCAKEELQIKKRLVEQMDDMDRKYAENMERMSRNMEKLSESIANGFVLLNRMLMVQQQPLNMYSSQPPPFHSYMQVSPRSYSNRSSTPSSPPFNDYDNQ